MFGSHAVAPADDPINVRRVTLVCGQLGPGGTERQIALLARGLVDAGVEVTVIALFEGGAREEEVRSGGATLTILGIRPLGKLHSVPLGLWRLWRSLRSTRPDVVHAFLFHAYIIAGPVARAAFVPAIVAGRRSLGCFKDGRPWMRLAERLTNSAFHGFIANTEAVACDAIEREGLSYERITVIPNALGPEAYKVHAGSVAAPILFTDSGPTVLCVANLFAYKGHEYLLKAVSLITNAGSTLTLILVGEGPERARLARMAERLDIPVIFAGNQPDVSPWLAVADIFVLPSLEEGMSNALMEAMAAGLPIVATDVGGNAAVLGDAGLICPPADPMAMARMLRELLENKAKRKFFGAASLDRAQGNFSLEQMTAAHCAYYSYLLSTSNRSICQP